MIEVLASNQAVAIFIPGQSVFSKDAWHLFKS
jgi:hypothetical protein